ncbi:PRC-barrel domain-containing protein [Bradyrhizobium cenepequi]|jgi:sporulation protein YlmC with PRC-barrel domain
MLAKYAITGLAASALLAGVAFAQTPNTATGDRPSTAETTSTTAPSSFKGNWRASKMAGLNVYNDSNESIGSINDMLMDKSGNIKGVVIGVGGFLGVGEHLVAVPFEKVKFVNEPIAYTGASNTGGARPSTNTGSSTTTGAATSTSSAKPNPWYPDHAVYSATKDELKAMPEFKYSTD